MAGSLDVLNCGAGHLAFTFDGGDALEVEKARRVIEDMLRRGYAIFLENEDGSLSKVESFDPRRNAYIVAETVPDRPQGQRGKRGPRRRRAVPLTEGRATGIGPTAGG